MSFLPPIRSRHRVCVICEGYEDFYCQWVRHVGHLVLRALRVGGEHGLDFGPEIGVDDGIVVAVGEDHVGVLRAGADAPSVLNALLRGALIPADLADVDRVLEHLPDVGRLEGIPEVGGQAHAVQAVRDHRRADVPAVHAVGVPVEHGADDLVRF